MTTSHEDEKGPTAFKRAQMRYRRQAAATSRIDDLNEMLDFSNPEQDQRIILATCSVSRESSLYQGPLFTLSEFPGFLYAPQALSPCIQKDLAFMAVSQYCEAPHATNIDLVAPKAAVEDFNLGQSMWELWKEDNGFGSTVADKRRGRSKKMYRSFSKLSWATMGYHYDWTTRAYHEDAKSPMPSSLAKISNMFARTAMHFDNSLPKVPARFTPSACIVNYYNSKSIMGGHRDDLELALDKPVVSMSLGLPAVFLLGGKSKDDSPVVPILVRPGDVMILGGDSRLCYHGMARVIPAGVCLPSVANELASPKPFQVTWERMEAIFQNVAADASSHIALWEGHRRLSDFDEEALKEYQSKHRININIRQVLPDGMDLIPPVRF